MRKSTITRYGSLLCWAILTGVAATVLVLELALRQLDGPEYVAVRQAEFDAFTWFIGGVFVLTLISTAIVVVRARRAPGHAIRPAIIALALLLLAAVVTLAINGPINFEQVDWNAQTPPADWASVRDRWQIAHAVRTAALALGLGFLTAFDQRLGHVD